jgi:dTDP-glucose pyrophosphorylase
VKNFVILAAGRSRRFGKDKLKQKFGEKGKTLPAIAANFAAINGAQNIYVTLSKEGVETDGKNVFHPVLQDIQRELEISPVEIFASFQNPETYGPGAAILEWAPVLTGEPFCVLFGDNLYVPNLSMNPVIGNGFVSFTTKEISRPCARNLQLAAVLDGEIVKEKPHSIVRGRYFCGLVVFPPDLPKYVGEIRRSDRGEIELSDMINSIPSRSSIPVERYMRDWADLTYEGDFQTIDSLVRKYENNWR